MYLFWNFIGKIPNLSQNRRYLHSFALMLAVTGPFGQRMPLCVVPWADYWLLLALFGDHCNNDSYHFYICWFKDFEFDSDMKKTGKDKCSFSCLCLDVDSLVEVSHYLLTSHCWSIRKKLAAVLGLV